MGSFLPVFLAFILNSYGIYIFLEPKLPGCGPFLSLIIFMFAAFVLLWDIRLYPKSLRKLGPCTSNIIEFFIATFLLEHLVSDFWLPLEEATMNFLPKVAEIEDDLLKQSGWDSEVLTDFLKKEQTGILSSYTLSIFFFMCVLHATRVVDFRLLRCGVRVFFKDVIFRAKRGQRKILTMFGFGQPKCVKFKDEVYNEDLGCDDENEFDFDDYDCSQEELINEGDTCACPYRKRKK